MQVIHLYSNCNIRQSLGHLKAKSLALKLGANKRKCRKFSVVDMLLSYWELTPLKQFSYDNWASQLSFLIKIIPRIPIVPIPIVPITIGIGTIGIGTASGIVRFKKFFD